MLDTTMLTCVCVCELLRAHVEAHERNLPYWALLWGIVTDKVERTIKEVEVEVVCIQKLGSNRLSKRSCANEQLKRAWKRLQF